MSASLTTCSPAPGIQLRTHHAPAAAPRGTVVVAHGRGEFVEKYAEVLDELTARGFDAWTFDWRGQGLSTRLLPDRHKGHIDTYDAFVDDLRTFLDDVVAWAPGPRLLLAHSMGGNVALRYLAAHAETFDGAVLTAPLVNLLLPTGLRAGARWLARGLTHLGRATDYVPGRGAYGPGQRDFDDNHVTSDPARFRRMHDAIDACPDLAIGGPTVGWLAATFDSVERLERAVRAGLIRTRTEVILAGDETLVDNDAARRLAARLPRAEVTTVAGSRHELLVERDALRACFWERFDGFVQAL